MCVYVCSRASSLWSFALLLHWKTVTRTRTLSQPVTSGRLPNLAVVHGGGVEALRLLHPSLGLLSSGWYLTDCCRFFCFVLFFSSSLSLFCFVRLAILSLTRRASRCISRAGSAGWRAKGISLPPDVQKKQLKTDKKTDFGKGAGPFCRKQYVQ